MSTTTRAAPARLVGLLAIIAGLALIVAGVGTWVMVRSQLAEENITVSEDARMFAGERVDGPLDAYFQADIINHHALEMSGGKTYAQLDREDPVRATLMDASFLRSSLFTSVIAFGMAAFAAGMGLLFVLLGWAVRSMAPDRSSTLRAPVTA